MKDDDTKLGEPAAAGEIDADALDDAMRAAIERDPTNDGRRVDPRPITDVDFEIHIPPHIRDNYAQIVREQHGGSWDELADRLDAEAEAIEDRPVDVRPAKILAAWARSQADEAARDAEDADPTDADAPTVVTKAPAGRTTAAKSTASTTKG